MNLERILSTNGSHRNLVLRLVLALVIFPHGAQKLFGWFGGYGFTATMGYFTDTVHVPYPLALLVVLAESVGALALAAGLFTRVAAAGIGAAMLGAVGIVHAKSGWFMNWFGTLPAGAEGVEFFVPVLALSALLVVEGAGRASVDAYVAARLRSPSLAGEIAVR